jgi:membrane fusion protein (multidrug efflux system)
MKILRWYYLLFPLLLPMSAGCDFVQETYASTQKSLHAEEPGHGDEHAGHESGDEEAGGDHENDGHGEHVHKVVATAAVAKDVVSTQSYVCQIHSCRHIEIRALERGYLEEISVKEGQPVNQGDSLFRIIPSLFQARLDADVAEAQLAQIEFNNAKKLFDQKVVSEQEVALAQAKLAKAQAQVKLAQAELNFTNIRAPFHGIIDRLQHQQGSLVSEGDVLTTLSDNSTMWVYFNVPEARYLQYGLKVGQSNPAMEIELMLADHSKFGQPGKIGAIEADFNNETGNIAFRADFPNPDGILRHGQTGNILIHQRLPNSVVIPQRSTFEILAKRYVYVVGDDGLVQQREITIKTEQDDIFVIDQGLSAGERIILEGVRQVRAGEHVESEYRDPVEVLNNLKNRAE